MSRLEIKSIFDGGDIVSTGLASKDGNTVGDDRKSSKHVNANDEQFALAA